MKDSIRKIRRNLANVISPSLPKTSNAVGSGSLPRIYFCHVPKCAGSSVIASIWNQIYSQSSAARFGIELAASQRTSNIFDSPMMRTREIIQGYNLSVSKYSFGSGHCYCRPNSVNAFQTDWNFVTILRNPVDRWISEYVYNTYKNAKWEKNELSLEDLLVSQKGIAMGQSFLRYFSNVSEDAPEEPSIYIEEALETLSKFTVVGTVERIDIWSEKMRKAFGVRLNIKKTNVSPKQDAASSIRSDSSVLKRIEDLCRYDMEIYRRYVEQDDALNVG